MNRSECLLIRGASQLITVRGSSGPRRGPALGELSIVENGAILVKDGVIEHVGPSHRIENLDQARHAREVDACGGVVLPGFVDSHTHLAQPLSRSGGAAGLPGVHDLRVPSASRVKAHAQTFLRWMASHGTTTAEVKSFCLGDESGELRLLRAMQSLSGSPIDLIPTIFTSVSSTLGFKGSPGAHAEWCAKVLLPLAARRKLAVFADILCEPGGYSLREARVFMQAARAAGLAIRAHAGLSDACGMVRLAVELGAVSADHLHSIGPDGVQALAGSRTMATLIPGRAFQSNSAVRPPARALIDSGAAVALATGFDGLESASCSMPMALSLACTALGFTAAEAIAAATINGAHALLCAERTGSLEVGKQADFFITAVRDYHDLPYYFGVQTISRVFRRGVEITPERN